MNIREFIKTGKGKGVIDAEAKSIKKYYKLSAPIEDVRNELCFLLLKKENEYNDTYKVETFIHNFIMKRLVFVMRKRYENYFHTDNGNYEFVDNVDLEPKKMVDTEMIDNIDSDIFVNECIGFIDSKRDREIIEGRLSEYTLDDIGKRFGITKESVRQRICKVSEEIGRRVVCLN